MAKFAGHMGKIAEGVTEGYQKIEDGVVGTYTKEGESVEDAKARVAAGTEAREAAQKTMVEKNLEASRNAGKRN